MQLPTSASAWPPVVYGTRDSSVESVMRRSVEAARKKYGPKPLQLILVLLPTKVRGCRPACVRLVKRRCAVCVCLFADAHLACVCMCL